MKENNYEEFLGDHSNFAESRKTAGRQQTKALVEMLKTETDMAESAMSLHKSIYLGEKRFQAEQEHIFLDQPLVACLSQDIAEPNTCLLYTSPSPRDQRGSRMPSSA